MSNDVQSGGIGLGTIICLILLVGKVFFHCDISWFWVFAPLWLPIAIFFGFMVIVGVIGFLAAVLLAILERK